MSVNTKKYSIHDMKTGRVVALIDSDGKIQDEGDPQYLTAFLRRLPYVSNYAARAVQE